MPYRLDEIQNLSEDSRSLDAVFRTPARSALSRAFAPFPAFPLVPELHLFPAKDMI
jgi:hypothetical protein